MPATQLRESYTCEGQFQTKLDGNKMIVAGRFSKADVRNGNGRIYRKSMWEHLLKRPDIQSALKERRMVGELGHPDKIETTPINISHIVTVLDLKPDGEVYGEAEILDTPSGQILKTLYKAGVKMGISSRGYLPEGSNLYPEGQDLIVPDDYELVTFDFVIDPSSQGACPTIKESEVKQLNAILTESRNKINSDVATYIEGLSVSDNKSQRLSEEKESTPKDSFKLLRESYKQTESKEVEKIKKEAKASMEKTRKYEAKLESIIEDLKQRYLVSEQIITDLVAERKAADDVLQGLTKRYLTAEQVIKEFRDYSLKLEETLADVVKLQQTSEAVIADLRDRYTLSESVIEELRDRYLVSEGVITDLRDRYTLSESVIEELRTKVKETNGVTEGLKESTSKQVSSYEERCKAYEDTIAELTKQLKESLKKPEKKPVPAEYFEDISIKYGITVQEAKKIFKNLGCKKSAFEFHLTERKRLATNRYSEFPYMADGSTSRNIYEVTEGKADTEEARIARLVEKGF